MKTKIFCVLMIAAILLLSLGMFAAAAHIQINMASPEGAAGLGRGAMNPPPIGRSGGFMGGRTGENGNDGMSDPNGSGATDNMGDPNGNGTTDNMGDMTLPETNVPDPDIGGAKPDADSDGLSDATDPDKDGDGLANPVDPDADGDKIDDTEETTGIVGIIIAVIVVIAIIVVILALVPKKKN